jgi:hypothetical protein
MGILSIFKVISFIFFVLLDKSSASDTNIDTELLGVECCLNEWQHVQLRHYDDVVFSVKVRFSWSENPH